ncbi:MAG: hypothetical protein ABJB16_11400 [Saprospiraceae bacterium]
MKSIDLINLSIIGRGAFADIFFDSKKSRVYKLYKSYDHPSLNGTGKEECGQDRTNKYRKAVFTTEFQAYIGIQDNSILIRYTPSFYGSVKIGKVQHDGQDLSNQYILDCCIEMECIDGISTKLNVILEDNTLKNNIENEFGFTFKDLLEEFNKCGVLYTLDSSAIINEQSFKLIDFATIDSHEFEPILG